MNINRAFFTVITVVFLCIFLCQTANVAAAAYPVGVKIIERKEAKYDTPENAYVSMLSSLIHEDIDWYYEGLTIKSAEEKKILYAKNNFNIQKKFDAVKGIISVSILDKKIYKDGVFLLIETINEDGSILSGPSVFVQENDLWKSRPKISPEDPILDYLKYIPPLFDGKGQRPADINSFLRYEQPTQIQTELEAGIAQYNLHIYYGETVDPPTFTAELNKQDISRFFTPKPFSDQEVTLPLKPGRNVLILAINGIRKDGKKAQDKDRLVFIVP